MFSNCIMEKKKICYICEVCERKFELYVEEDIIKQLIIIKLWIFMKKKYIYELKK